MRIFAENNTNEDPISLEVIKTVYYDTKAKRVIANIFILHRFWISI